MITFLDFVFNTFLKIRFAGNGCHFRKRLLGTNPFGICLTPLPLPRWSPEKDLVLLREVCYVEPYKFKHGTKESGQAWNKVASGVNQHEGLKVMARSQRSVRDRFNKLLADFKK